MGFQLSPGTRFTEIDLTGIVPAVSTTEAGVTGAFQWGALNTLTLVDNEKKLVNIFFEPDGSTYNYWFTAKNFLDYSNKLWVVRVADEDVALNATTGVHALTGSEFAVNTAASATTVDVTGGLVDTELSVGQKFDLGGIIYTVASIASNIEFTTSETFAANVSEAGANAYGVLVKNDDDFDNNWNSNTSIGVFVARYPGDLGSSLKVSVCPGSNAYANTIAAQVTFGAGNDPGNTQIATDSDAGAVAGNRIVWKGQHRKITVANSSIITVDTPFGVSNTIVTSSASSDASNTVQLVWDYYDYFDSAPGTSAYAANTGASTDELHLIVVDEDGLFTGTAGTILEKYEGVSAASDAKTESGVSNYYKDVVNNNSAYIRILSANVHPGTTTTNWGTAAGTSTFAGDNVANTSSFVGGVDGSTLGNDDLIRGFDMFKEPEDVDVSFILTANTGNTIQGYVIDNICDVRKDCIAFVSPPSTTCVNISDYSEAQRIADYRNDDFNKSTSYAVMDGNWKYQYDKYNDVYRWVPLNGDIAGVTAEIDQNRDPWWSPGNGRIKNVARLAFNPSEAERDVLYKNGVNPIVKFKGEGAKLFGDKTLLNKPSAFNRINVRRLFIVIEKAISVAARSLLFQFNDAFTRAQFKNLVEPYLRDIQGRRGITDFRVVADETNNTGEVIDRNEFVGDIYVKPARSINFIQLNFIAVRTNVEFEEVVGQF